MSHQLLVLFQQWVELGHEDIRHGTVLKSTNGGQSIQLLHEGSIILQRILQRPIAPQDGLDGPQHAINVAFHHIQDVILQRLHMSLGPRLWSDVWDRSDQSPPQCQEIVNGVRTVLPIPNRLCCKRRCQIQPFQIPFGLYQFAQLIVGLKPPQQSTELMIVILMLQTRLIFEKLAYPRHDPSQKCLTFLIRREEGSSYRADKNHGLHGLVRSGRFRIGIKIQQQFNRTRILQHRSPVRRRLDSPHILRGFIRIGTNEIKVETPHRKAQRLLPQYNLLPLIRRANRTRLQLLQRRQPQLKHLEQTQIAKAHRRLAMLRQCTSRSGYIQLVHELIQYLETEYAVIYRGLEEFGNVLG
mmetsp:Transcript_21423/g.46536  ORF Transcript_21423/g.46536 Transcript_21423/m.46536 type:complete len:355 (+) Transcript_21423:2066-3130(+)